MPSFKYEVSFRYRRLKREIGVPLDQIPIWFKELYGERITEAAVYYWFSRNSIPVNRLIQVLHAVRVKTHRKLDIWRYIDAPKPDEELAEEGV